VISRGDRILVVGRTGSGKSVLARRLAETYPDRLLIIDPADSTGTDLPGAHRIYGGGTAELEAAAEERIIRWVPSDTADLDAYDEVYRWAFHYRYPGLVWVDEAGIVLPAHGGPPAGRTYLVQGRKRVLGHLACHTRPREIDRNLIAQAQHLFIFDMPNPDDQVHIADQAGVSRQTLTSMLRDLPEFGWLYFSQRDHQLVACDPIEV